VIVRLDGFGKLNNRFLTKEGYRPFLYLSLKRTYMEHLKLPCDSGKVGGKANKHWLQINPYELMCGN